MLCFGQLALASLESLLNNWVCRLQSQRLQENFLRNFVVAQFLQCCTQIVQRRDRFFVQLSCTLEIAGSFLHILINDQCTSNVVIEIRILRRQLQRLLILRDSFGHHAHLGQSASVKVVTVGVLGVCSAGFLVFLNCRRVFLQNGQSVGFLQIGICFLWRCICPQSRRLNRYRQN